MKNPRQGPVAPVGHDTPTLRRARQLWEKRSWDAALAEFERAVLDEPQNARALIDGARAFGARYRYEQVGEWLERLVEMSTANPVMLAHVGESYQIISRHAEAVRCYERARELARGDASTQLELARLYERLHRLEEADGLIQGLNRSHPNWPSALLLKARIERRLKRDSQAETTLRQLLAIQRIEPDVAAAAWAELGQILDRSGDVDGAMEAVVYSKQLMLPRDAAERKASDFVLARFRDLFEGLRAEDLRRWQEQSQSLETHPPLVLLTGFPRSGTTLLEQVLDSHPQVVSSEERDIMGFEVFPAMIESIPDRISIKDMLDRVSVELLACEQRRYFNYNEAWIGEPLRGRMLLDKNPGSTLLLPVFLRVFPKFRALIALRDPRDVVLSCFMLYLPLNPLSVSFLTLERAARRYAQDMASWLKLRELFPLPWLEARYEDTVADLPAQARRVLEFLGVAWDPEVLAFHEHAKRKTVLSPTYAAVTQPVHRGAVGRWKRYAEYLEPILPILDPFVKAFGYDS